MTNLEFSVPCLFGLEGLAGDELKRMGIENVRVENGRVLFSGDERAMVKANVGLRTGERVLIVLADFTAKSFEELFQGVYRTNLEDFIPKDGAFPVKGHCLTRFIITWGKIIPMILLQENRRQFFRLKMRLKEFQLSVI